MNLEAIEVEQTGDVGHIVLNRPAIRKALSRPMVAELHAALAVTPQALMATERLTAPSDWVQEGGAIFPCAADGPKGLARALAFRPKRKTTWALP